MKKLNIPRKICTALAVVQFVMICLSCHLHAKTITANSASFTDVSNAVASASPGDTVTIPAGTALWTNQLTCLGVSLIGSGTNQTVIVDNIDRLANDQECLILFSSLTNGFARCSNFQITGGNTTENYKGEIVASMDLPARIDNLFFNLPSDKGIIVGGTSNGLIDHCTFVLSNSSAIYANGDGFGDVSWATPVDYGTSNALYIEDCLFTNVVPNSSTAVANDAQSGAREVFRHNIVLNTSFQNHGTESGLRYRSSRSYEIYDNTFVDTQNYDTPIFLRGGTGVIFSNTAVGYYNMCSLNDYRMLQTFGVWGGATGFNPWDDNSPTLYATVIHAGSNNSPNLVASGVNWTPNQWVGYTVNDLNSGLFSIITSNSANVIYTGLGRTYFMSYNTKDTNQIYLAIQSIDQVGLGSGDLLGDIPLTQTPWDQAYNTTTGTASWPHEVSEPLYLWGNTLNGQPGLVSTYYPNIQENLDYYNQTAKPGYTPFTYPHPLAVSTVGGGQAQPGNSLTNGLAAWWPLNEGTGTIANDASGNGNDGTFGGSTPPQWKDGFLYFNGAGYINCGTNNVPMTFPITISYWVNFGSGGGGTVLDRMLWGNEVNWRCDNSDADVPTGNGNFSDLSFGWKYNIADNNWHLVTATVSPNGNGNGTASIYLDSTNVESQTGGSFGATLTGTPTVTLGIMSDRASAPFTGYIADVRIYTNVLSASQIQMLYSNGPVQEATQGSTQGLVAWWKFDEGSGTIAHDSSGNGNDGTLGGSSPPQWNDGALSFNGAGYITCGTNNVPTTFPLTVSYWVNFGPGGGGTVLDRMIWNNEVNWRCNESSAWLPTGDGNYLNSGFGWEYNISDSHWHLITATVSNNGNGTGTASIYLDSTNVESQTGGIPGATSTGTPTISLGIGSDYQSGAFSGQIDDVRIYTNALSPSAIQTLYLNGRQ